MSDSLARHDQTSLLKEELRRLKDLTGLGQRVSVKWRPGEERYRNGRALEGEVRGNEILVYTVDPESSLEVLRHEFAEWLLNQHTRPYRRLLNKFIEAFEEEYYVSKERTVRALMSILDQ